ncbi:MAG: hypothetical protein ACTSRR_05430 [Candidatus Heimdallarchaeaceae archaeon]
MSHILKQNVKIPKEILPFYKLFNDYEKEQFQKLSSLNQMSNLNEIGTLLLDIFNKEIEHTSYFMLALGRILYHTSDMLNLENIYKETDSAEIGLWYAFLRIISSDDVRKEEILLDQLKEKLNYSLLHLLWTIVELNFYVYSGNQFNFRETKDIIINRFLVEDIENREKHKVIFKLFYSYILIIEINLNFLQNHISYAKDLLIHASDIIGTLEDRILESMQLRLSALIELRKNNFSTAQHLFLRSLALADMLKEIRFAIQVNSEIGDLYLQMGHVKDAKLFYDKSLELLKKHVPYDSSLQGILLSKIADYYFVNEKFQKSLDLLDEALSFFKVDNNFSFQIKLKYIEYLLNLKKVNKAESLLVSSFQKKDNYLYLQNQSFCLYLRGFIEFLKKNFGKAQSFLYEAIGIADRTGDEWTSSKSLVLLLILLLLKYNLASKVDDIVEADKCVDDIITFLEEKAKFKELAQIYLIRAKIRKILLDFETSLFLLKTGENIARQYYPELITKYEENIDEISRLLNFENIAETETPSIDFKEDIDTIFQILIRQTKKLGSPIESITIAVLIFHSSGIPVRTYRSEELYISDDMIFGGFVSAIRHLLDELFYSQESKSLSVDHGQYKLLIEFYKNLFSIVILTVRDSFLLRRKMHQLVSFVASKDLFKEKYFGKIDELALRDIDSFVEKLFKVKKN